MNRRDSESAAFAYRTNANGSIDSICLDCFLTVGNAQQLSELKDIEKDHHRTRSHLENLFLDKFRFPPPIEPTRKRATAA